MSTTAQPGDPGTRQDGARRARLVLPAWFLVLAVLLGGPGRVLAQALPVAAAAATAALPGGADEAPAAGVPGAASGEAVPGLPADDGSETAPLEVHQELLVGTDQAHQLVWDAGRRAGAVSVPGHVLLISELLTAAGAPAGALGLSASVPLDHPGHLALGIDDGMVYVATPRDARLHALHLGDGRSGAELEAGGPRPELLFEHPALHRLLSFNAGAGTLTLFDLGSGAFEGLIPLGDAPVAARLAPDGRVLALLPERRELTLIGVRPLRIFARWTLPEDCPHPADLDVDPAGQRALLACGTAEVLVFDLREAEWRSSLLGTVSGTEVSRVFWDGAHGRVVAVGDDGSVASAAAEAANVLALGSVPAGSALGFDSAGSRLVWAAADARAGLHLGFSPLSAPGAAR